MAMSNYLKNNLYNEVLRNTNYAPPATVYLALFTSATTDAGGGTEVVGGSYTRQAITFGPPTNGAGANSSTVTYTNLPGATITHGAITDSATAGGGNFLLHGPLNANRVVIGGDTLTFDAADIAAALS